MQVNAHQFQFGRVLYPSGGFQHLLRGQTELTSGRGHPQVWVGAHVQAGVNPQSHAGGPPCAAGSGHQAGNFLEGVQVDAVGARGHGPFQQGLLLGVAVDHEALGGKARRDGRVPLPKANHVRGQPHSGQGVEHHRVAVGLKGKGNQRSGKGLLKSPRALAQRGQAVGVEGGGHRAGQLGQRVAVQVQEVISIFQHLVSPGSCLPRYGSSGGRSRRTKSGSLSRALTTSAPANTVTSRPGWAASRRM